MGNKNSPQEFSTREFSNFFRAVCGEALRALACDMRSKPAAGLRRPAERRRAIYRSVILFPSQ
jgi:hypothetical protein